MESWLPVQTTVLALTLPPSSWVEVSSLLPPLEESGFFIVDCLQFWAQEWGSEPWVLASQGQCALHLSAQQDLVSVVSSLSEDQADLQGAQGHVEVVTAKKSLAFDVIKINN